ncbi:thioester-containing protein 1 allele R1-like isoform X2 [Eupeodes corollae]|uniref:thioester-containing protein 1 allele R1-like isoform X2 n=1 Tax=Eupeodes corollae TaxID=290404 RepID=UPI00248FACFD|nr:thioester-containing protein 1 allele R1-like isoform X2 [Eupeodes corollae]
MLLWPSQAQRVHTHQRYELKTSIEVPPNTIKLIELQVPTLLSKRGHLEVLGYKGVISRDLAEINIEHDSHSVFIQTNKAKYKLGELVQFRLICIDRLTRPAQLDSTISVLIYDSQDNLIKFISNVKLIQGVFRGKFQLSDYPPLGEWKIGAEVGGNVAAEKRFQVAKYMLPEFSVKISTKSNVALNEDKLILTISANYFYDEPVKGNLTILLERTYSVFEVFHYGLPVLRKESDIDGNATFVLDMKNNLNINKNENPYIEGPRILYKFRVKAFVTDILTEQQLIAESDIVVHSQPSKMYLQVPKMFDGTERVLKILVKFSITDLEDIPIIVPSGSMVKIMTECKNSDGFFKTDFSYQIGKQDYVNVQIENQNFTECKMYAKYQEIRSRMEHIKRNEDTFYLDVLTESPEVGKVLEVKLKSLDPIEHFIYEIVSRGDIIQSEYLKVPEGQKMHIFHLNLTYVMVPKITIYVHRIKKRSFTAQLKEVYIKRAFQNSIEILTDSETIPGSSANISVTTDGGSYVGLMGLDHRILQNLHDDDKDLTENHFYQKLQNYDSINIDNYNFPGQKAGLLTFSNAFTKIDSRFGENDFGIHTIFEGTDVNFPESIDKPSLEFPHIRKIFSDSWLYKDFESTPAGGFSFMETVPDTITSWAITGFSLNPKTGLTLTKNATNLKVFQKYFVSVDLPSLVTEGETIEVAIYVSNYMEEDALTNVMIESDSDEVEIFKKPEVSLQPKEPIQILVPSNRREKLLVYMKPLKSGKLNITVKALAPAMASDAVEKILNVKSEGLPYKISKTYLVHLPKENTQENEITVDIPEQAVPGSQRVELSIVGDIFRPLLRSLQKLARVPYGHGEDNMRFVISNLLALKYLKALNYNFPSLESKLRLNIELGYQNQLCFKHLDGSFGLFDRTTERTGDIWQTAFALWGLKQSKDFIHVESKVFERGLDYLKTRQQTNGCFRSKNGIEEDIEYTALTLMVFLMDKNWRTSHSEVLTKGLTYLYENSDSLGHSSITALAIYVLTLGRHEKAGDCLKKLSTNRHLASQRMSWKKTDSLQSHLETTAESLLNLFEFQGTPLKSLLHIIRGLIATEDGKSSLTHLIALHAMLVFIEGLNLSKNNLTIFFTNDQNGSGQFQITSENSQILQTFEVSEKTRRVHLQSRGYGFAVVGVIYKYNLVLENQLSSTYATNITTERSSSLLSIFEVCVRVLGNNSGNHLTMMEVTLQSGYAFTDKITPQIGLTWKFKSLKVNDNHDMLIAHIDSIDNNGLCLKLETLKKYNVLNAKPSWVVLYDTHKRDDKTIKSFKINDS